MQQGEREKEKAYWVDDEKLWMMIRIQVKNFKTELGTQDSTFAWTHLKAPLTNE